MTTVPYPTGSMVVRPRERRDRHLRSAPCREEMFWESTPMDVAAAAPALREVVRRFSGALDPFGTEDVQVSIVRDFNGRVFVLGPQPLLAAPFSYIDAPASAAGVDETSDVLDPFDTVRAELGLTQKEMFEATGIKKRTYHSWRNKPPGTRPRVASQGRFWSLVDAVEDLREMVDRPLHQWIRGDRHRLRALRDGRFDDLVDLAVNRPPFPKRSIGTSVLPGTAEYVDVPVMRSAKRNIEDVVDGI